MTTDAMRIRRENARDWPIFRSAGGPALPDIDAVAVEVQRDAADTVAEACDRAAHVLTAGLGRLGIRDDEAVLAAAGPMMPRGRLADHIAARDRVWAAMERRGTALPSGRRHEFQIATDDAQTRFAGYLIFPLNQLPTALAVTRQEPALCLATSVDGPQPDYSALLPTGNVDWSSSVALLRFLVRHVADVGFVVMRSFGGFDDRVVGAEAFCDASVAKRLEHVLTSR